MDASCGAGPRASAGPTSMAFNRDGSRLAFASWFSRTICVLANDSDRRSRSSPISSIRRKSSTSPGTPANRTSWRPASRTTRSGSGTSTPASRRSRSRATATTAWWSRFIPVATCWPAAAGMGCSGCGTSGRGGSSWRCPRAGFPSSISIATDVGSPLTPRSSRAGILEVAYQTECRSLVREPGTVVAGFQGDRGRPRRTPPGRDECERDHGLGLAVGHAAGALARDVRCVSRPVRSRRCAPDESSPDPAVADFVGPIRSHDRAAAIIAVVSRHGWFRGQSGRACGGPGHLRRRRACLRSRASHRLPPLPATSRYAAIAISPDGRWVVTGSHSLGTMRLWDAATGRLVHDFPELPPRAPRACSAPTAVGWPWPSIRGVGN